MELRTGGISRATAWMGPPLLSVIAHGVPAAPAQATLTGPWLPATTSAPPPRLKPGTLESRVYVAERSRGK